MRLQFYYQGNELEKIKDIYRKRKWHFENVVKTNQKAIDYGKGQKARNIDGTLGDYSLWKFLDIWPMSLEHRISLPLEIREDCDCIYEGWMIEAKHTRHGKKPGTNNPHLIINDRITKTKADIFVLTFNPIKDYLEHVEIAGWITRERFDLISEIRYFNDSNQYPGRSVTHKELSSPFDLKKYIEKNGERDHPYQEIFGPFGKSLNDYFNFECPICADTIPFLWEDFCFWTDIGHCDYCDHKLAKWEAE